MNLLVSKLIWIMNQWLIANKRKSWSGSVGVSERERTESERKDSTLQVAFKALEVTNQRADENKVLAQEVTLSIVLCFDDNKPNKCYLVLMF